MVPGADNADGGFLSLPSEDYALIGDCHTAALVSNRGSIDWLWLPHFDSAACFAALVGSAKNGHWTIARPAPYGVFAGATGKAPSFWKRNSKQTRAPWF